MTLNVKSPTRIDLAGGTLDCWPLHAFVGPSTTINLAIDLFTEVSFEERSDAQIIVESVDQDFHRHFENLEQLLLNSSSQLVLLKVVAAHFLPAKGFRIRLYSQTPTGGGLGGSSSLLISIIKTFYQWLGLTADAEQMILLAKNLEAQVLRTPTGTQDYIAAVYGGLNFIHYNMDKTYVESLPCFRELEDRIVLVFTGRSHNSGINNWDVIQSAVNGDRGVIEALHEIRKVSAKMERVLRDRQLKNLGDLFREEYFWRLKLSPTFTSSEIQKLESLALGAGAEAIKICGAGGGGCVLLWCPPEHRDSVINVCQSNHFQVLRLKSVEPTGAKK